jgi:hypothetical protein
MAATWDRKEKTYSCKSPPISWYFGGKSPTAGMLAKVKENPVKLRLTLNGKEWIWVGYFEYYDPVVDRLCYYTPGPDEGTEEEIQKKWVEEEAIPPVPADPEELKALETEAQKKAEEENEEIATTYRRTGTRFFILGSKFRKTPVLDGSTWIDNQSSLHVRGEGVPGRWCL